MYDKHVHKWLEQAGIEKPVGAVDLPKSEKVALALNLIQEELDEIKEGVEKNDLIEVIDGIVDLKWVVNNLIYFANISKEDIDVMEAAVLKSNLTKFCKDKDELRATIDMYASGNHPDKPGIVIETYCTIGAKPPYVVKRVSDDKIMKSINYKPVNEIIKIKNGRRK